MKILCLWIAKWSKIVTYSATLSLNTYIGEDISFFRTIALYIVYFFSLNFYGFIYQKATSLWAASWSKNFVLRILVHFHYKYIGYFLKCYCVSFLWTFMVLFIKKLLERAVQVMYKLLFNIAINKAAYIISNKYLIKFDENTMVVLQTNLKLLLCSLLLVH